MRLNHFLILAFAWVGSSAATLDFGFNTISIPAPAGYEEISKQEDRFAPLWYSSSPDNEQLAVFMPKGDLANAKGEADATNYCYVQQYKQAKGRFFFAADMKEIADVYRKQGEMNAHIEQALRKAQAAFSQNAGGSSFKILESAMLPVFYEGRDSVCTTMIGDIEVNVNGTTTKVPFATSLAVLVVRGNLIMLYVADKPENMERTRVVLRDWVEQVAEANPYTTLERIRYLFPGSSVNGFDYWRIVVASLNGAAIGLVVYMFRLWKSRRVKAPRASTSESS